MKFENRKIVVITSTKTQIMRSMRFVCYCVNVSFCRSVFRITAKVISRFHCRLKAT